MNTIKNEEKSLKNPIFEEGSLTEKDLIKIIETYYHPIRIEGSKLDYGFFHMNYNVNLTKEDIETLHNLLAYHIYAWLKNNLNRSIDIDSNKLTIKQAICKHTIENAITGKNKTTLELIEELEPSVDEIINKRISNDNIKPTEIIKTVKYKDSEYKIQYRKINQAFNYVLKHVIEEEKDTELISGFENIFAGHQQPIKIEAKEEPIQLPKENNNIPKVIEVESENTQVAIETITETDEMNQEISINVEDVQTTQEVAEDKAIIDDINVIEDSELLNQSIQSEGEETAYLDKMFFYHSPSENSTIVFFTTTDKNFNFVSPSDIAPVLQEYIVKNNIKSKEELSLDANIIFQKDAIIDDLIANHQISFNSIQPEEEQTKLQIYEDANILGENNTALVVQDSVQQLPADVINPEEYSLSSIEEEDNLPLVDEEEVDSIKVMRKQVFETLGQFFPKE